MEELLRLLRNAQTYDLAVPVSHQLPVWHNHAQYSMSMFRRHGDVRGEEFSSASEILVMSGHTGTHIDAPAHISRHGRLYGGVDALDCQGWRGMKSLGIETVPPLLTRGVLLDVAGYYGKECLAAGQPITPEELQEVARRQEVQIQPGDVVLVRTGWVRHLFSDSLTFSGRQHGAPGPTGAAAAWLAAQGIRATGADTAVYEHYLPTMTDLQGHMTLLADNGIPILEFMDLEHLAREQAYTFLFVCAPLKLVGATGSPVRPLAVVAGR